MFSLFKQALENCKGLQVSPYMLFVIDKRILWAMGAGLGGGITKATLPEVNKRWHEMGDMHDALVRNTDTPFQVKIDATDLMLQAAIKLHPKMQQVYDCSFVPLEKQTPNDPQVLCLKGKFYIQLAWATRGSGYADSVAPQQWKDFAAQLEIARDALTKSYDADPEDPEPATQMILVAMGQGGDRDTMEKWFSRAMATDPDNLQACYNKMNYLEPKWHGDPDVMIQFGRQSLESGNWHTPEMPLLTVEAHNRLSAYDADPIAYYRKPGVWVGLRTAYTAALEMYPESARIRSLYCRYACLSGQWEEANSQFKLLGDKADPAVFASAGAMEECRKQAAALAGDHAP